MIKQASKPIIAVAPMLDWTDKHCRYFHRICSKHSLLYTEMVTVQAVIHGGRHKLLEFDPLEDPVALQLGGSEPALLAACAKIGMDYGYAEINLNVGCPSDRVQSGRFGACLMAEPELVADCIAAMHEAVSIPVTVKTRIGIDEKDSYEELVNFVNKVSGAGATIFIIHARKAWLKGLSPKENREIPPLRYDIARALKHDFPHLSIILNGGIKTFPEIQEHLNYFDGVMLGREAYHNPYFLAFIDQTFYDMYAVVLSRKEIVEKMLPYIEGVIQKGGKLNQITRHMLGLFQGMPGARNWRRHLSEYAHLPGAGIDVIKKALEFVESS